MSRKRMLIGLAAMVAFQTAVLAAEYINAVYPLWTGKEVRLKTVPVDPRSLFRGNYARLRYEITGIERPGDAGPQPLRAGETVYVILKPGKSGHYEYTGASLAKPGEGLFIRGRLQSGRRQGPAQNHTVRYGIEAYFAPRDRALALEKELRDGGVAIVMVAANGKAALREVIGEAAEAP